MEKISQQQRIGVAVGVACESRKLEGLEGDKRSKVEVTADEICPSLRWATAQVTRTERRPPTPALPTRARTPSRARPPGDRGGGPQEALHRP
jgi:single-strand DNA-binding protein